MVLNLILVALSATAAVVSLTNLLIYPVFESQKSSFFETQKSTNRNKPKVSILIPCRNEENSIEKSITSIMNQSYKNIELIICNDNSTDSTSKILKKLQKKYDFKVIQGKKLAKGWLGKNYACHQLSQTAKGNILCFLDADVTIKKHMIKHMVSIHKGGLLSIFPKQIKKSIGEWLIVPLMKWFLLSALPFYSIKNFKREMYVAANGQCMCFSRDAYELIGGHVGVKQEIVEDMALARLTKRNNKPVQTLISQGEIQCRMYNGFKESIDGFSKNFFAGTKKSPGLFIIMLFLAAITLIYPFFIIPYKYALITIGLLIINQLCIALIKKEWQSLILFPLQNIMLIIVGVISLTQKTKTWKGRNI